MILKSPIWTDEQLRAAIHFKLQQPQRALLGSLTCALIRQVYPDSLIETDAAEHSFVSVAVGDGPRLYVFQAPPAPDVLRDLIFRGDGAVTLASSRAELDAALAAIVEGRHPGLGAALIQSLAGAAWKQQNGTDGSPFSPREDEVLTLLHDGLSNREIAERLFVSTNTVRSHLQSISIKLGVSGRARILAAVRQGEAATIHPSVNR